MAKTSRTKQIIEQDRKPLTLEQALAIIKDYEEDPSFGIYFACIRQVNQVKTMLNGSTISADDNGAFDRFVKVMDKIDDWGNKLENFRIKYLNKTEKELKDIEKTGSIPLIERRAAKQK